MRKVKPDLLHGVIWQQILLFFFPVLFGTLFQQLYNTVDAIVVGNFVGKHIFEKLNTQRLRQLVYIGMIVSGIIMLF